jgi:DNA-binding NarL/FixJ family response regulator
LQASQPYSRACRDDDFLRENESVTADARIALNVRLKELTPQQLRVLNLIRRGFQNKRIAKELRIADQTVKAHVTEILRKLRLLSRNQVVVEISKIDLQSPPNL